MRVSQLPLDDRYFVPENDYRPNLKAIQENPKLHAIIHMRQPAEDFMKRIRQVRALSFDESRYLGHNWWLNFCHNFDHIVVAVGIYGECYVGISKVNLKSGDKYSRRFGFRMAVKNALEAVQYGTSDFEIGMEPPHGRMLKEMITMRLKQFGYLKGL